MRLCTNNKKQPLLQTRNGDIINLNTLEPVVHTHCIPLRWNDSHVLVRKNNKFLEKAKPVLKVSRLATIDDTSYYILGIQVLCVLDNDNNLKLIGNYPIHYLKLLYRYVNSL